MIPATWSLAARIGAPLLILAVAAGLVWGYGQRQRLAGRAEVRAEWDQSKQRQREVDAAEQARRLTAQREIADAAQKDLDRLQVAASTADRAHGELQQRYAAALAKRCDPATPGASASAPDTDAVLADVFGRIDEAASQLAFVADQRGRRGEACERAYEALTNGLP